MAPRWPEIVAGWGKMAPDGPKLVQADPRMVPRRAKMGTKEPWTPQGRLGISYSFVVNWSDESWTLLLN